MESILPQLQYWCHVCQKEFTINQGQNINCPVCLNDFCEIIQQENNPKEFKPFTREAISGDFDTNITQIPRQTNIQQNLPLQTNITVTYISSNYIQPSFNIDQLIQNIFPNTQFQQSFTQSNQFEQILHHIMQNDPNNYGPPPCSAEALNQLKSFQLTDEEIQKLELNQCSVCKDEFNTDQEIITLPCNHIFHMNCILPWLKHHNSCPTCRQKITENQQEQNQIK